jgi:hypothetical protein
MTIDLTASIDNYALYLPAINSTYAEYVIRESDALRSRVRPLDFNFLDQRSVLWTYKWSMASAGHLAYSQQANAVTRRNPRSSVIIGDSGGYQFGTGALRDFARWDRHAREPQRIAELWRASLVKDKLLRWLELHCDYAMTFDLPLWVKLAKFRKSPFHHCDVKLLTELTVENLRFISDRRGALGNCQFLNVLHGQTEEQEEFWYRMVRDFDFEGWAIGGSVGARLDLRRVLKRMLILRDEGLLGGGREWFHVLGISQLPYAVAFTAIQRAVQKSTGTHFTISFDTSTPLLIAGRFERFAEPPSLTMDIHTWRFTYAAFPTGYAAANRYAQAPFPAGSPVCALLSIGDMNPRKSPYAARTFDTFSQVALANHNAYVVIRAIIEANAKVFTGGAVPQKIADLVGIIAELFVREQWSSFLAAKEAWYRI